MGLRYDVEDPVQTEQLDDRLNRGTHLQKFDTLIRRWKPFVKAEQGADPGAVDEIEV